MMNRFGALLSALTLVGILAAPAPAAASSYTFNFNCQITIVPIPDQCVANGSYGTLVLSDSPDDPNRVRIALDLTPPAQYSQQLEQFYLNFNDPKLDNHIFYLVTPDAPDGVAGNTPYGGLVPNPGGYRLGSVQYTDSNSSFQQFKFDVNPDPGSTSLHITFDLALYNQNPPGGGLDQPVNLDASMFLFLSGGDGTPALAAGYRTNNTACAITVGTCEFWAGASLVPQVNLLTETPEPATLLLFGTGLVGLAAWRKRAARR